MKAQADIMNWLRSNIDYGKSLVVSTVDGARSAKQAILHGARVNALLARSTRNAWPSVAIGAGLGLLCGFVATHRKPHVDKVLVCALLGGAVGLSTGLAWETRGLTGGIAHAALKNMNGVRDAHWLASHPINYG